MRTCKQCNATKTEGEFYRYKNGRFVFGKCKMCITANVGTNYRNRREQYAAYERKRFTQPERRAKCLEYQRRRREAHPEKYHARNAVNNALKTGKISRPPACTHCHKPGPVQAHHTDYSKPLDVQWFCFKCHREVGHGQVVTAA